MSLSRSATWTQRPGSPRKELHRLPEVVEPADALLPLDRHPGRVDLALERGGPPELRPRPDLRGGDAERHPLLGDGEARVQEQAAEGVVPPPAPGIAAAVDALGHADRGGGGPPEDELGRVLQQQDHPRACPEPIARRREVTAEDA